jgi:hypothetical protein
MDVVVFPIGHCLSTQKIEGFGSPETIPSSCQTTRIELSANLASVDKFRNVRHKL